MLQKDLVKQIDKDLRSEDLSKSLKDSERIFKILINCFSNELVSGKGIIISNFGKFESNLRNYKPKGFMKVARKKFKIKFIPSNDLEKKLNERIQES